MEALAGNAVGFQVLAHCRDGVLVQVRAPDLLRAQLQGGDAQDTAARSHVQKFCPAVHGFFQLADAQLGGLVHPGSKGGAGIDLHQQLVLVLLGNGLPGGLDQNVVHGEGLEILLPVVDPVLVLGLGGGDGALSQIREHGQLVQTFLHLFHQLLNVAVVVHVEAHLCHALVRRQLRQNVDEHSLGLPLRERHVVLNLHALDADVVQHAADQIDRLGGGSKCKFFPFHNLSSPVC